MKQLKVARPVAAAAMCACAIGLAATTAQAKQGEPIQGTEVGLDHDPEGIVVRGTTDTKGHVIFAHLKPGHYTLVIDGKSLAKTLAETEHRVFMTASRVARDDYPASSHSSFSIGIGGMFGGGSHHASPSREDDPVKGARGGSRSSHSGGGMGIGFSIPIGGDSGRDSDALRKKDKDWDEAVSELKTVVMISGKPVQLGGTGVAYGEDWSQSISLETPRCRKSTGDMKIGFDLPHGGGVKLELDDVNAAIGDVSTTRLKTAPDNASPTPRDRLDIQDKEGIPPEQQQH